MAIFRLLQNNAFTPEDVDRLVAVYEDCRLRLKLGDSTDAACERIAKAIIEVAQTGQRDPDVLRRTALKLAGFPDE